MHMGKNTWLVIGKLINLVFLCIWTKTSSALLWHPLVCHSICQSKNLNIEYNFLVQLSRRLKCTIVIMRCPSSVRPSVCPSSVRRLLFIFSTSPLKPLYRIQRNLTGSKNSTSSTKFVFFGTIGKTRWQHLPLIGWDIFNFSSETAEQNSKKLDSKQNLKVLYQVCVFRADWKNKMAALPSDWLTHFPLLLWNCWMEFNKTWQEARYQIPLQSLCFSCQSEKQDGHPGLWPVETFSTSHPKPLNRIQQNLTGSKISTSSTKFVFFRLIGKTRWTPCPLIGWDIFNFFSETAERNSAKTWQEARSQRPLPSLCFSG